MKANIYTKELWVSEVNPDKLKEFYKQSIINAGFTIVDFVEHYFLPQGYTAIFLLAESHFAIHTFPEENITFVQLSSCNKQMFEKWIKLASHIC